MSVYIPGISMPETCYDNCPCQGIHWCNPLNEITEPMTGKRLDNCPLVNVPPHGDLIDRDKLEEDIERYIGGEESRSRFHHWVQVQSVVIPREKGAET